MTEEEFGYTLPVEAFDTSLLPEESKQRGTDAFRAAISRSIQEDFKSFGGSARIEVDADLIRVSWQSDPNGPDPLQVAVSKLESGKYDEAIRLLEHLRQLHPDNSDILRNLGMALSDKGKLDQAESYLTQAIQLRPNSIDALVALGVVLARQNKYAEAVPVLEQAVAGDSTNLWANRNLGACLLQIGRAEEAESYLRKAVDLNPKDQQSVLGLGHALEAGKKFKEADDNYIIAIDLDPRTPIADIARQARSKLAQTSFRKSMPSGVRPDAVMYLLSTIRQFEKLSRAEIQKISFEIALLGQTGLDPNSPEQKYELKSLPGRFSGLNLLCIMYVGFNTIAPGHSIGFDLSKEFEVAKVMNTSEK